MTKINELTKNEMATYLYVRDILRDEAELNNYFSMTDILLYLLPVILIIIFILIGILFYRTNNNKKIDEYVELVRN